MSGPRPPEVLLTDAHRQGLKKLVQRHSTKQQIALRARIILLAAAGKNNAEIARELKTSDNTTRRWRGRWLDLQPLPLEDLNVEERLEDLPRPGPPSGLTADQICQIEQLACEKPEEGGRPISQWTGREIADELVKRGIVDKISARHAARLLKRGASNRT
jgi:transposase